VRNNATGGRRTSAPGASPSLRRRAASTPAAAQPFVGPHSQCRAASVTSKPDSSPLLLAYQCAHGEDKPDNIYVAARAARASASAAAAAAGRPARQPTRTNDRCRITKGLDYYFPMLPFATRRLRGARVLARVRWRSGEGPPLPPQQGTVGGPDYAPSRPRDNQGRALHPRVGAAAAVPPSIPMWGSTPSTAPSQVSVRTSSVPPPPPPAPLAADDTAPRAQLSAAAFSPERLRELGVGGLDEQLASLFRRAFASRAGTPGLARRVEQRCAAACAASR
jgi:hypothetical protein